MKRNQTRRVMQFFKEKYAAIQHSLPEQFSAPNFFHLNRRSFSKALAIGTFIACVPLPGHMLLAAWLASLWGGHVLIAAAAVWMNNPLTMLPIYYLNYRLGLWMLHSSGKPKQIDFSISYLVKHIHEVCLPLFLGGLVLGLICAAMAFGCAQMLWRLHKLKLWRLRQKNRRSI